MTEIPPVPEFGPVDNVSYNYRNIPTQQELIEHIRETLSSLVTYYQNWRGSFDTMTSLGPAYEAKLTEISEAADEMVRAVTATADGLTAALATAENLDARIGGAESFIDRAKIAQLHEYPGVDNTGATECSAAIQAAVDDARAKGFMLTGRGMYRISSTVEIDCDCDLSACTFNYYGTGVAVQLRSRVYAYLTGRRMMLPRTYHKAKVGTGWVAGSVGIRALNTYQCNIFIPQVDQFETGVDMRAVGYGCAYNTVTLGMLYNNKRNLNFSAGDAAGWVNENKFIAGRFAHDGAEGSGVVGCRHINCDPVTIPPNNNMFLACSLEGPGIVDYNVYWRGRRNYWNWCRWEHTGGGKPSIYFDTTSGAGENNVVMYGSHAENLQYFSNTTPKPNNSLYSENRSEFRGNTYAGALTKWQNSAGTGSSVWSVYEPTADITDNSAWSVRLSSLGLYLKALGEAYALISITTSGHLVLSNSTGSGSVSLSGTGGPGVLGVAGINTSTTAPAPGSASALPGAPAGYMHLTINGTVRKIPYYA